MRAQIRALSELSPARSKARDTTLTTSSRATLAILSLPRAYQVRDLRSWRRILRPILSDARCDINARSSSVGASPSIRGPTEGDLRLHRLSSVARHLEGPTASKGNGVSDQRLHVDQTLLHQPHARRELLMEAEGSAKIQLLGRDCHHRHAHVSAETQLDDHAARPQRRDSGRQRRRGAGAFVEHIERALVGRIGRSARRVRCPC